MKFTKMQGCGNDYVYVNGFEERVADPGSAARIVSDRHFGVGSDGLILILPSAAADFRMQMFNADGSEGEMCGNGIRCVAKYVFDRGMTKKTELGVETKAGIKRLVLEVAEGKVERVRVNMGEPRLERSEIPMVGPPGRVLLERLAIEGETSPRMNTDEHGLRGNLELGTRNSELVFVISCVSMGNPHTIVRVDDVASYPVREHGPLVENHPAFPVRTNVEFVEVLSRREVRSRTWERGAGETLACGTGASATVVACSLNGWTERKIVVHLLGGDLDVEWAGDGCVYMTGPAVEVFSGEIEV